MIYMRSSHIRMYLRTHTPHLHTTSPHQNTLALTHAIAYARTHARTLTPTYVLTHIPVFWLAQLNVSDVYNNNNICVLRLCY